MAFLDGRIVTVDHTRVAADQSDFPILIKGIYPYLATAANGGNVQNSNGYDIVFSTDDAGVGRLDWETVFYDPATGSVEYHVKVPTLSASVDTSFYMKFGDSSITTDQSNKTAVWSSNFKMVQHLPNGTALTIVDSTSNANNGTPSGAVTATTGFIDGAANFSNTLDAYIDVGDTASLTDLALAPATFSFWLKLTGSGGIDNTILSKTDDYVSAGWTIWSEDQNTIELIVVRPTSAAIWWQYLPPGAWHRIVITYSGTPTATGDALLYVNGSPTAWNFIAGSGVQGSDAGNPFNIGGDPLYTGAVSALGGILDEIRVAGVQRSASWILTEYNTQVSPPTFYSLVNPQPLPPGLTLDPATGIISGIPTVAGTYFYTCLLYTSPSPRDA